ncbi:phosphoglycolate phosphatase [Paracoccus aminophilus]|nr:phosphoglycolate phosphatase [Paracoccus aminophilus]
MNTCLHPCPLVFDLDGTLIDSAPDIRAAVNEVLAENGLPALTLAEVHGFIGGGVEVLWRKIIAAKGLSPEDHARYVAAFLTRYEAATGLSALYPGVTEALETLATRGHALAICTNKPLEPARAVLRKTGLDGFFRVVIGGDSLPVKKPDPAPVQAALAALGADPLRPDGIYIGDSEYDASAALAAGVPFFLFTEGYRHLPVEEMTHHTSFSDFKNLPSLVEKLRD